MFLEPAPSWNGTYRMVERGFRSRRNALLSAEVNAFPDEATGRTWYLHAIGRHLLLIAAVVALGVWAAYEYSDRQEPRYEAAADLLISPLPSGDSTFLGIDVVRDTLDGDAAATVARFAASAAVAERATRTLNIGDARNDILQQVDVQPRSPSNTVTIVGKDRSPERAARIANAFADAVIAHRNAQFQRDVKRVVRTLSAQLAALPAADREATAEGRALQDRLADLRPFVGDPDPTIRISAKAAPPGAPVWPRPRLAMAIAGLAALFLGIAAAIAFELVNPLVRREEDLTREHALPVLARVPPMSHGLLRDFLSGKRSLPPNVVDAFRTLRVTLAASQPDGRIPATILVTGPTGDVEKASVAVALASSIALAGPRVILVDADFRNGHVSAAIRDRPSSGGAGPLLAGVGDPEELLVREVPGHRGGLGVIVSTREDAEFFDYLDPERVASALEKLREHTDVVVFTSASLSEGPETFAVAKNAEAVIVAVRLRRMTRKRIAELRAAFSALRLIPDGFVVVKRGLRAAKRYGSAERVAPSARIAHEQPQRLTATHELDRDAKARERLG